MKFLNFGSLNIDHVFGVLQIVKPGQTIDSLTVHTYPGGKGLNQSLAAAKAGAAVSHAGLIGTDGLWLRELLERSGVDCRYLETVEGETGSAFIQVDENGQNSIVLNGGSNRKNTPEYCRKVLADFGPGDLLLLQNEISSMKELIDLAWEKGMKIVLNPSPMNENILASDLGKVSLFLMNEDEGQHITGRESADDILAEMRRRYPDAEVVLTLGSRGSCYQKGELRVEQKAYRVQAVDTTAAGDTFTGFFLAALAAGREIGNCLDLASRASAIAVTREGAASSIPTLSEVETTAL